ncbi:ChbG/HpnK family deacetylase [Chelatococcus reniformis]|nr:ChbG/HpnK family deacetylase [Chelatococcus reniformis]
MPALKPFILCADDYALTDGVSRGILELAAAGRLGATSAMTNRPQWRRLAPALGALGRPLSVGLHLNLTLGEPLTRAPSLAAAGRFRPLGEIVRRAFAGRLVAAELRAEIAAQLDAFGEGLGRMPDYVDGHQHVHVLPGVREQLLAVLGGEGLAGRLWIRDPGDMPAAILARRHCTRKALLLRLFAHGFAAAARRSGFATNAGFAGFSRFAAAGDYAGEFATYLIAPGQRHLVMCHPGYVDDELRGLDPAVESRPRELMFLVSRDLEEVCEAARMRLARDWH